MPETAMKQYREQAHLSITQLARLARIDDTTVRRAERGEGIQEGDAEAIVEVLSKKVGQELSLSDLGITTYA